MDIKKTLCLLAFLVLVMGMISAVSAADDVSILADDSGMDVVSDSSDIGSVSTDLQILMVLVLIQVQILMVLVLIQVQILMVLVLIQQILQIQVQQSPLR